MKEALLVSLMALTLIIFAIWPGLDIATSALFFDGTRFPLETHPAMIALRWVLRVSPVLLALAGLALAITGRNILAGLSRRDGAVILTTFLLGPGLLANRLLKAYWGRARPRNIAEFGGDALFTPPHEWANQCAANCSFVSGEVSGVTALSLGLTLILQTNRAAMTATTHAAWMTAIWLLPVLSAFQRISAGAHFLSDALMAVGLTLLTGALVGRIANGRNPG